MIQSRDWKQIETLPERPGVAVLTSGGYWLDGQFYPTHRAVLSNWQAPTPSLFQRMRDKWRAR